MSIDRFGFVVAVEESFMTAFIAVFVFTRVEKSTSRKWAALNPHPRGQEANPCPRLRPPTISFIGEARACAHTNKHTHARTHVLQHTRIGPLGRISFMNEILR